MAQGGLLIMLGLGGAALLLASRAKASKGDGGITIIPPRPPKKKKGLPTDVLPAHLQKMVAAALKALTVNDLGVIVGPVTADAVRAASTVAGRLREAGYFKLAAQLQAFIDLAKKKLPPKDKKTDIPKPSKIPPAMWARIQEAIQLEQDIPKLKKLLASMKAFRPKSDQMNMAIGIMIMKIAQLEAMKKTGETIETIDKVIPKPDKPPDIPPIIPPVIPPVKPPVPPITPKSKEQQLAEGLGRHLFKLQGEGGVKGVRSAKGNEDVFMVKKFQAQEGSRKPDGKVGPGTMMALAKYISPVPLVMYWPKGSTASRVYKYRNDLNAAAEKFRATNKPNKAKGLEESALRERGQGGIVGKMPT